MLTSNQVAEEREGEGEQHMCIICREAYLDAEVYGIHTSLGCGCHYHFSCLLHYIRSKLGDRKSLDIRIEQQQSIVRGILCPKQATDCCSVKPRYIIDRDEYLRLREFGLDRSLKDTLSEDDLDKVKRWIFATIEEDQSILNIAGVKNQKEELSNSDVLIDATTKPCPKCRFRASHAHGHHCHHISPGRGCSNCKTHFCYKCLSSDEMNRAKRGSDSDCLCGYWSSFCSPLNTLQAINTYLTLSPYPTDSRCGCAICWECRVHRPCSQCTGNCSVCLGHVPPGPSSLSQTDMTSFAVALQNCKETLTRGRSSTTSRDAIRTVDMLRTTLRTACIGSNWNLFHQTIDLFIAQQSNLPLEGARQLVRTAVNNQQSDNTRRNLLHYAAHATTPSGYRIAQCLIDEYQVSVTIPDTYGRSALQYTIESYVAERGRVSPEKLALIATMFISAGGDYLFSSQIGEFDRKPFLEWVLFHAQLIELLFATYPSQSTELLWLACKDRVPLENIQTVLNTIPLELLVRTAVNNQQSDNTRCNLLHYAARAASSRGDRIAQCLIDKYHVSVTIPDSYRRSALQYTIESYVAERGGASPEKLALIATMFRKAGRDYLFSSQIGEFDRKPFLKWVLFHPHIVKLLVATYPSQSTELLWLAKGVPLENIQTVLNTIPLELLVRTAVNNQQSDNSRRDLLYYAARAASSRGDRIAQCLIDKYHVSVTIPDSYRRSALQYTIEAYIAERGRASPEKLALIATMFRKAGGDYLFSSQPPNIGNFESKSFVKWVLFHPQLIGLLVATYPYPSKELLGLACKDKVPLESICMMLNTFNEYSAAHTVDEFKISNLLISTNVAETMISEHSIGINDKESKEVLIALLCKVYDSSSPSNIKTIIPAIFQDSFATVWTKRDILFEVFYKFDIDCMLHFVNEVKQTTLLHQACLNGINTRMHMLIRQMLKDYPEWKRVKDHHGCLPVQYVLQLVTNARYDVDIELFPQDIILELICDLSDEQLLNIQIDSKPLVEFCVQDAYLATLIVQNTEKIALAAESHWRLMFSVPYSVFCETVLSMVKTVPEVLQLEYLLKYGMEFMEKLFAPRWSQTNSYTLLSKKEVEYEIISWLFHLPTSDLWNWTFSSKAYNNKTLLHLIFEGYDEKIASLLLKTNHLKSKHFGIYLSDTNHQTLPFVAFATERVALQWMQTCVALFSEEELQIVFSKVDGVTGLTLVHHFGEMQWFELLTTIINEPNLIHVVDWTIEDATGNNLLHTLCWNVSTACVKRLLLDSTVEPVWNSKNKAGLTLCHMIALKHLELLSPILNKYGQSIDLLQENNNKETIFNFICQSDHPSTEIVMNSFHVVLDHANRIDARLPMMEHPNGQGASPLLALFSKRGFKELPNYQELVEQYTGDINKCRDLQGHSLLQIAFETMHEPLFNWLLRHFQSTIQLNTQSLRKENILHSVLTHSMAFARQRYYNIISTICHEMIEINQPSMVHSVHDAWLQTDRSGYTPLQSFMMKHRDCLRILEEVVSPKHVHLFSLEAVNSFGQNLIHVILNIETFRKHLLELFLVLFEDREELRLALNHRDLAGNIPIMLVMDLDDKEPLRLLLETCLTDLNVAYNEQQTIKEKLLLKFKPGTAKFIRKLINKH